MIQKILYATDLGAFTAHGLAHVESLAASTGAEIYIVHAVPPIGELAAAVVRSRCSDSVKKELLRSTEIPGLLETLRDEIYEIILQEPFDQNSLSSRVRSVVVRTGAAANVILSEAEECGADLIVVGSHSIDAIDGRLLGSVAAKILQLSKTPVYLIPMMNPANIVGYSNKVSQSYYRI